MNIEWTDATTYSRDKPRIQKAWQLNTGSIVITITANHIYNKGVFTMHCFKLGFDTVDLKIPETELEKAKEKAIRMCTDKANKYASELNLLNK